VAQLRAVGIAISKRQVMRLLIAEQQPFLDESQDVLRAGLQHASWITVDDTGARHRAENGSCTQRCRRGCGGKWGGVVSGLFRKP
jgi:hypothetical protein